MKFFTLSILFITLFISPFTFPLESAPLATCNVPSDKPTIGAATSDLNCDIINIAANVYSERITIQRNLQLIGNFSSDTIIDGGAGGTVITIAPNIEVGLSNITIRNGRANQGGGIYINSGANISTSSVVLQDNVATSEGGHVYSEGGITLLNVIMRGGQANNGGGIYTASGDISLEGFTVQDNTATTNGGGIFGNGQVLLENGFVQNNTAGTNGGGVFSKGNVNLLDVNATGNVASADGGAIYAENANTTVNNTGTSKLSGNRAANGGAIFGFEGNIEVVNTDITFNNASINGGGIFVSGDSPAVRNGTRALTIRVQDSDVEGNDADVGGAIEVNGTATVRLVNVNLFDNKARLGAGVNIAGGSPSLEVSSSSFTNNNATEDGGGSGGGIRADGQASIILSNAIFENNDAATDGGAISIENSGVSLAAFNAQFKNNRTFTGNGGAIYAKTNSVQIDKVAFVGNNAASNGGGIYLDGTGTSIINSTFSGNNANAAAQGSAIWARAIRIDFSTIAFNTGTSAIFKSPDSDLFVNNSIVHNPAVTNCAGIVGQVKGTSSIDSDNSCTLAAANGNLTSDPQLNPTLLDDGGTLTHPISSSSPASNSATNCIAVDQRNVMRGNPCDRGAYELSGSVATAVTLQAIGSQAASEPSRLLPLLSLVLLVASVPLIRQRTH